MRRVPMRETGMCAPARRIARREPFEIVCPVPRALPASQRRRQRIINDCGAAMPDSDSQPMNPDTPLPT
jgi:hypothetical protein